MGVEIPVSDEAGIEAEERADKKRKRAYIHAGRTRR